MLNKSDLVNKSNEYNYSFKKTKLKALILSIIASVQFIITNENVCADEIEKIIQEEKDYSSKDVEENFDEIIKKNQDKYSIKKSIELIWKNEFHDFIDFFWLKQEIEILAKISEIQIINNLTVDWIIWPETLKILYKNYYSKNKDKLTKEQLKRLKIANDVEIFWKNSPNKKVWIPNVFNNDIYYWIGTSENLSWTLFNKELYSLWIYEMQRENKKNEIILEKNNWKFHLLVYIEWKLSLLSFASPGWNHYDKKEEKVRKYPTPIWKFKPIRLDIDHYSSSRPKDKKWNIWWAPMYYGINFYNDNYWIHLWKVDWNNQSYGCVRLPAYYAEWLFNLLQNYWIKTFKISIKDN